MKSIPIALQGHKDQDATTTTLIVRVLTKSNELFSFTELDADILFDPSLVDPHDTGDDWGSALARADWGLTPSRTQATADLSVDNAELTTLMPDGDMQARIRTGLFTGARVRSYLVNYMDLSQGHEVMQVGRLGALRTGNGWAINESRSLKQLLRQPISDLYSLTCPKRFGSKAIGTGDGSFEEKRPCGKDFTWTTGTITSIGSNARRIFGDTASLEADDYYDRGVIEILDGPNVGQEMEVDVHTTGNFTLLMPLPFALTVGVSYRRRKDCSKEWDDAENGCLFHYGTERSAHFGGMPDIPVADAGQSMTPGAQITRV